MLLLRLSLVSLKQSALPQDQKGEVPLQKHVTWTHPYARDSSVVKHTDPTSVGRVSSPLDPRPLHYAALPAQLCNSQPCALNVVSRDS